MIDKTVRMNYLFDFYQELLTTKQNQYMSLYYLDDWSLGEIADYFDVSRQAVYDNIRRTEAMVEQYETKLRLFDRFEKKQLLLKELKQLVQNNGRPQELMPLIEALEKLE
ncbi:putative DNA-binding protein [Salisediminibacterium beveridgei]|uniref:UPF0122 protein BBEV_1853 n=1 Tax=Salisediminibacterium beveridgei TaxID=632773 RepID=A0A1D7QW22_9BACI|nr:putative DNA-binding protein [Salisediminibacterium beveridgei]AOM83214.1 hypothetical protein BBEV_1853 [Salisediminibacterium beveridgei]